VNWVGTYRNWIRRAAEQNPNGQRRRPSTTDALIAQTQALKTQLPTPPELLP
jgi:hypothetical protein